MKSGVRHLQAMGAAQNKCTCNECGPTGSPGRAVCDKEGVAWCVVIVLDLDA